MDTEPVTLRCMLVMEPDKSTMYSIGASPWPVSTAPVIAVTAEMR